MKVSARTPEGDPSMCPICEAKTNIEFSQNFGDATCPQCGCLLWRTFSHFSKFRDIVSEQLGVEKDSILSKKELTELGSDSLDTVELVMELEDEFAISIPDPDVEDIRTVGQFLKLIEEQIRKSDETDQSEEI